MQINIINLTLFSHNFTSSGCTLFVAVEALWIDVLELGQLALKSMDSEKEREREFREQMEEAGESARIHWNKYDAEPEQLLQPAVPSEGTVTMATAEHW